MDDEKRDAMAMAVLDAGFGDGESLETLREKLGVPVEEWELWMKEGLLTEDVVSMARAEAGVYAPRVWASLLALAGGGNLQAIKLYFELWKGERRGSGESGNVGPEIAALRREILSSAAEERSD